MSDRSTSSGSFRNTHRPLGHRGHRARFGHGRDRRHRGRHRPARPSDVSSTPRWAPAVGGHRLHADAGRPPAARRFARRPVRPPADLPHRGRLVRRWPRPPAASPRTPAVLIATRVLQGIGGALLTPGSLAILQASFEPDDRGRAIGAWSGLGRRGRRRRPAARRLPDRRRRPGGGSSSSTSRLGAVVAGARGPPRPRVARPDRRPAGSTCSGPCWPRWRWPASPTGSSKGPALGWTSAGGGRHAGRGRRGRWPPSSWRAAGVPAPMLPLSLFRRRQFSGDQRRDLHRLRRARRRASSCCRWQLQVARRYSPLDSGLALLPADRDHAGAVGPLRAGSPRRIGPRLQMSVGPVVVGAGLALLAPVTTDVHYCRCVLPAVVVFGLGLAITVAPLTATAMAAGARGALRARLGGQQRRGPLRRPDRRGGPAGPGRHLRSQLPPPGRVFERVPDGHVARRRRCAWPAASSPPSGSGTRPVTRLRCARPRRRHRPRLGGSRAGGSPSRRLRSRRRCRPRPRLCPCPRLRLRHRPRTSRRLRPRRKRLGATTAPSKPPQLGTRHSAPGGATHEH